jgi:hemerythrin-like domain-containing protein
MNYVHTSFLREFGLMPDLVRGVGEGDAERAGVVADHIEMVAAVLHHHHEGEDLAIWPRLLERCPEEIRPLVRGMEEQHELIASGLDDLTKHVAAWRADASGTSREAVAGTVETMLPVMREHLGEEVRYVLPLIEKHIEVAEWDEMVSGNTTTVAPELMPVVLGMMMYDGDPRVTEEVLATMPDEVRSTMAELAPRAYGDHAQRVYGTRTPPHLRS